VKTADARDTHGVSAAICPLQYGRNDEVNDLVWWLLCSRVVLISRLSKYQPPTPLCQSTIKVNSIREKQIKII